MNKGALESSSSVYHINPNLSQPPPLMTHQPPLPSPLPSPLPLPLTPNCFFIPPSQNLSTSSSTTSSPLLSCINPNFSSWLETSDLYPLHHQSWSLSQLLLGGLLMGEEESMMINHDHHNDDDDHHHHQNQDHHYQERKLENWEEQVLRQETFKHVKQENNINGYVISSPIKSSLTTTKNINPSLECKRAEIGGSSYANKKLKLQVPYQSTNLKVRKEKLGGRIAGLHQLVSPFGKTDTASVLSEAIGYIRFLHCQIEALSLPYFGTNSRNNIRQQHAQSDVNCIFPEDPGQLENEQFMRRSKGVISSSSLDNQESNPNQEQTKDLRSRGLCLVPISSTLQIGTQNGADYWNPGLGVSFQ